MDITRDRWSYVRDAKPLAGHRMALAFEDGRRGVYDMTPLLGWPVYGRLTDPATFGAMRVEGGEMESPYASPWLGAADERAKNPCLFVAADESRPKS